MSLLCYDNLIRCYMRLISISDNKVFFVLFAEVLRIKSDLTTAKQLSRLEIGYFSGRVRVWCIYLRGLTFFGKDFYGVYKISPILLIYMRGMKLNFDMIKLRGAK